MRPGPGPLGERELVTRLRGREERGFAYLLERHHRSLVWVVRGYVRSQAVAEEVAQETWAAAFAQIDGFEERCSLKTWIFRIAVNKARSHAQREARTIPFSAVERSDDGAGRLTLPRPGEAQWTGPSRAWNDPARRLESLEFRAALRGARATPGTPATGRRSARIEGLSPAEVCELLDLSDQNQRVLLHRGRARLRAELAEPRDLPAAA
jgi:RNA polymerase sigma-70 factor (ECF subfamily)